MKSIFILFALILAWNAKAYSEQTAKLSLDIKANTGLIIFYDGEKELGRKVLKGDDVVESKGSIPDGLYKLYNVSNKIVMDLPVTNGKMNGKGFGYDENGNKTINSTDFNDDKMVTWESTHCKKQGNKMNCYGDSGKLSTSDTMFPDGKVKARETYYENGKMFSLESYNIRGDLDGIEKNFYETGKPELTGVFTNGIGWVKKFNDEDGKLVEYYRAVSNGMGYHDGPAKIYDYTGKLSEEDIYETNVLLSSKEYLDNGNTIEKKYNDWGYYQEKSYDKNNHLTGETERNRNGDVIMAYSREYDNGEMVREKEESNNNTLWEILYLNGIKISDVQYIHFWENYHQSDFYQEDGSIMKSYFLNSGQLYSNYMEYFPGGKIKEDCGYKNGVKEGLDRLYNENGGMIEINTYKKGYKINAKKYDEMGKLVLNQDYPYQAEQVSENTPPELSDTLRTAFINTGRFTILERTKIKTILEEQAFQMTGLTSTEDAAKMGNILNVKYIATGSITKVGSEYVLNVRVVQVENSEILAAETGNCGSEKELVSAIDSLAKKTAEKMASLKPESSKKTMAVLDVDFK
jgi:antitoxin component YwqK of YwqJK toxin-antitoxin module/TolB-like protein